MSSLVLIDASVSLMLIAARISDYRKSRTITEEEAERYVIASLMLIDSNYWIRGLGDSRPIWLLDSKPYWRSQYLPTYKQNRLKKDADGNILLQSNGEPIDYKIPEYAFVYEIFKTQTYNTLAESTYEADDIAGTIIRIWHASEKKNFNQIILSTIDTDWAGLVDNDVVWVSQKDYGQRIRGHLENFTWLWGKFNKQYKKEKLLWTPPSNIKEFHSRNIFDWKIAVGDKADNIKANGDPWMVNLLSPHPDHDLCANQNFMDNLTAAIRKSPQEKTDIECRDLIRYIDSTGLKLPLSLLEWKKPEAS